MSSEQQAGASQVSAIFRNLRRGACAERSEEPRPPSSLDELVSRNQGFVIVVARRYRGFGIPLEDLINAGNMGLVEAARRFDPSRGAQFVTYAVWWIRKMICEAVSREAVIVFVPSYQRRLARRVAGADEPLRRIREIRLDETGDRGDRGPRRELRTTEPDPEHAAMLSQNIERLRAALAVLPRRERLVLQHRYGLDGATELSLHEIGRTLGVSRERVRQIEQGALGVLCKRVAGRRLPGPRAGRAIMRG
jgi:RNA polymerase primary sigma factor